MTNELKTTGKITIDGELIETANLVFYPVPENQCCRTQHENTKKHILGMISANLFFREQMNDVHQDAVIELQRLYQRIGDLKLEDTK